MSGLLNDVFVFGLPVIVHPQFSRFLQIGLRVRFCLPFSCL